MIQPSDRLALVSSLGDLLAAHPELRLGQLLCNLTLMARGVDGSLWDIEDDELLKAAAELLGRQSANHHPS